MNQIRLKVERFDGFQGFIVNHSASGCTGSGLSARIMAELSAEYKSATKSQVPVYPSQNFPPQEIHHENNPLNIPHKSSFFPPQGPPVRTPFPIERTHENVSTFPYRASPLFTTEPSHDLDSYNAVFSMSSSLKHSDVSIVFENEALHNICSKKLGVKRVSHRNMNEVAAHALSCATTGMRFEGGINADLNELRENLVYSKRVQFLTASYAPLFPKETRNNQLTVGGPTAACFENDNQTVRLDVSAGSLTWPLLCLTEETSTRGTSTRPFENSKCNKKSFSAARVPPPSNQES